MTDFARAIPILLSLDLAETQAFVTDGLGFRAELYGDYLIMRRDEIEIHYSTTHDRMISENTSCYIRGGQVPALYEEMTGRDIEGAGGRLSDFAVRPWGMKEFYIWDPHGNLMKFGCAPEEV